MSPNAISYFCHPALSFRLVSSQGPKMDPRWWHYTKIAMYHVPILERGGNVSHNPRLSTVVLMLGMTLCALFSANQPLTRGKQWPYWFLPLQFILWSWGQPPVRLGCLTRIKEFLLERARWSSLDMGLGRAALGLYQQVIPLKPGDSCPPAGRIPGRSNTQIVMIPRKN